MKDEPFLLNAKAKIYPAINKEIRPLSRNDLSSACNPEMLQTYDFLLLKYHCNTCNFDGQESKLGLDFQND